MAYLHDDVLDNGLSVLDTLADRLSSVLSNQLTIPRPPARTRWVTRTALLFQRPRMGMPAVARWP